MKALSLLVRGLQRATVIASNKQADPPEFRKILCDERLYPASGVITHDSSYLGFCANPLPNERKGGADNCDELLGSIDSVLNQYGKNLDDLMFRVKLTERGGVYTLMAASVPEERARNPYLALKYSSITK